MPLKRRLRKNNRLFAVITGSMADFFHDNCINLSAAIAFYMLLSLFPLIFLIVTIYAELLGESIKIYTFTLSYLKTMLPGLDQRIIREIDSLMSHKELGYVGVVIFVWLASQVFFSLEYAVNTIFRTPTRRHILHTTVLSVLMIIVLGIFFILSFAMTTFARFLRRNPMEIGDWNLSAMLAGSILFKFVIPFVLILLAFSVIYKILPYRKVSWENALVGGVITALLWEAAKHLFTWYVGQSTAMGAIYGSLSTIIFFLLWIYYSAAILLFGAEIVHKME